MAVLGKEQGEVRGKKQGEVETNPYQVKIAEAYTGTVFFDVRSVTTTWLDCMNRDVDPVHVDKLASVFEAGVERVEEAKRLKVTMTNMEWIQLLEYLSKLMNGAIIPSPASLPVDVSALQSIATDRSRITSHLNEGALTCPLDIPVTPVLEAGQHRKTALEKLLTQRTNFAESPEGKAKDAKPASKEDFRWSVDVYIREHLDREALFALRANREEVSKADSNGDLLIRILTILRSKPLPEQTQLLKASRTKVWLTQAFGCGDDQFIGRLLQVIRARPGLQNAILAYCRTRYGAVHFRLTWASNVVLAALDFIWILRINDFVATSEKVFGKHLSAVRSQDFETLMAVLPIKDTSTLRLLFFPSDTDLSNNLLIRELALSSSVATNTLPEMKPFNDNGKLHNTRRPDFLPELHDDEYCSAYILLRDDPTITIPTWRHFSQLDSGVSSIVTGILKHVLTWYNASWEFPQKADERRRTFEWAAEFEMVVLVESELEEDKDRGYDEATDLRQLAETLILHIWDLVEKNAMWREKSAIAEAKQKAETVIGDKAKPSAVDVYHNRFEYAHWADILSLIREKSGPALSGHMAKYNSVDLTNVNQSTSSFGQIATAAIFKESQEIIQSRFLNTKQAKDTFVNLLTTTAHLACYHHLKQTMVATLQAGYPKFAHAKQKKSSSLIQDDEEWVAVRAEVERYASMLVEEGQQIDLDDINEMEEGEPRKPGFLTKTPLSASAQVSKRKPKVSSSTATRSSKRVKKD